MPTETPVIVNQEHLQDIADAIRSKNGSIDTYTPAQMAAAISAISTSSSSSYAPPFKGNVILSSSTFDVNTKQFIFSIQIPTSLTDASQINSIILYDADKDNTSIPHLSIYTRAQMEIYIRNNSLFRQNYMPMDGYRLQSWNYGPTSKQDAERWRDGSYSQQPVHWMFPKSFLFSGDASSLTIRQFDHSNDGDNNYFTEELYLSAVNGNPFTTTTVSMATSSDVGLSSTDTAILIIYYDIFDS